MICTLKLNNLKYIWDIKDKEISTSWDFFAQKMQPDVSKRIFIFFVCSLPNNTKKGETTLGFVTAPLLTKAWTDFVNSLPYFTANTEASVPLN